MTCAVCHAPVEPMSHYFFEGLGNLSRHKGERPAREWWIAAPLYFASNATFTAMIAAFCGAEHCLQWHEERR